ncbi:zinc transporter ZIP1 [Agrilus planipennis]|uniref:Zinc transporter ZIP1 n=1 Tax=Agrilus planipennis TaxID=224129 RepID=A0A1W4WVM2_AGRPL|nr:zinc transporter ZIP1 [Agrilus planipennis]XP_018327931.1 zinc transporter ZIP1 [Agrilus planipennis]
MADHTYRPLNEYSNHQTKTNNLMLAKFIAMGVLGIGSFLLGLLPIKLTKFANVNKNNTDKNLFISLLLCFGGGVLLFTTFIHLQPEVRSSMEILQSQKKIPNIGHDIPLSELVFCIGFFFVYLVEEAVHLVLDRKPHDDVLHRSLSVKCLKNGNLTIPRVNLNKLEENGISFVSSNSTKELLNSQTTLDVLGANKMVLEETHYDHVHFSNPFRSLLAVLALSFHAVFEGLAVGLENNLQKVWYLFAAIATHKLVIAFCVGVELVVSKTKLALLLLYIGTFALVTPLGIGIGIILSKTQNSEENVTSVILQGMAAGTLLYVVFFEVLARERGNKHNGVCQLLAILIGFLLMFSLQYLIPHDHNHEHGK